MLKCSLSKLECILICFLRFDANLSVHNIYYVLCYDLYSTDIYILGTRHVTLAKVMDTPTPSHM